MASIRYDIIPVDLRWIVTDSIGPPKYFAGLSEAQNAALDLAQKHAADEQTVVYLWTQAGISKLFDSETDRPTSL